MDAKAQGLEETSPRAISLQQIIVALNMVSKVIFVHKLQGCVIKHSLNEVWHYRLSLLHYAGALIF